LTRPPRAAGLAAVGVLAALAAGCAPALREPGESGPRGASALGLGGPVPAASALPSLIAEAEKQFARRPSPDAVEAALRSFHAAARADEARIDGLLGLARTASWAVEQERDTARREALVSVALWAGQWCEKRSPGRADCAYALAQALGQQAREHPATSHDGLGRMTGLLRRAAELDPGLDEAGPERVLALVLLRAPGWPAGPGDAEEGLRQARAAVALRPEHPPNRLALAEALRRNGQEAEARAEYTRALERARALQGPAQPDASTWAAEARGGLGR